MFWLHVYGSSRLGVYNEPGLSKDRNFTASINGATGEFTNTSYSALPLPPIGLTTDPVSFARMLGNKQYELSNHLGNVQVTVNDKKLLVDAANDGTVDYYTADVSSYVDYYAFGMEMPGRTGNSTDYRYGFNGKESDSEWDDGGNMYDYGFRIYNPRIARFLSVDPLAPEYPFYTPYQFAGNRPIDCIDIENLFVYNLDRA